MTAYITVQGSGGLASGKLICTIIGQPGVCMVIHQQSGCVLCLWTGGMEGEEINRGQWEEIWDDTVQGGCHVCAGSESTQDVMGSGHIDGRDH